MKCKIHAKTFNGTPIHSHIEVFLESAPRFTEKRNLNKTLTPEQYGALESGILNDLEPLLPDERNIFIDLEISSKDLEKMHELGFRIDTESLVLAIKPLVFRRILETLGETFDTSLGTEEIIEKILKHADTFRKLYLEDVSGKSLSPIEEIEKLLDGKKYIDAFQRLTTLSPQSLTHTEKRQYDLLRFKLSLKNYHEGDLPAMEKNFEEFVRQYAEYPETVRKLYFSYIRFLEDLRRPQDAKRVLKRFEKHYSLTILDREEASLYHYLEGRALYAGGEFIYALEHLSRALELNSIHDRKMRAAILNTSANCFGDNLLFKEAFSLAEEAMKIRKELDIPELVDSISCLAGLHFRQGNFQKSYQLFRHALDTSESMNLTLTSRERNRLFNYLAQAATLTGRKEEAFQWLEKAEKSGGTLDFTIKARLLYFYTEKDFESLRALFKQTIMLPQNHQQYDSVVLGWGYALMARTSFALGEINDGIQYLFKASRFFMDDKYYLEAAYLLLYLYRDTIEQDAIELFFRMDEGELLKKLDEFVPKHCQIRERFSTAFGLEISKDSHCDLEKVNDFLNETIEGYYDPEEIEDFMEKQCLY